MREGRLLRQGVRADDIYRTEPGIRLADGLLAVRVVGNDNRLVEDAVHPVEQQPGREVDVGALLLGLKDGDGPRKPRDGVTSGRSLGRDSKWPKCVSTSGNERTERTYVCWRCCDGWSALPKIQAMK